MILEFLVLYPFLWVLLLVVGLWAEVYDNHITNAVFTVGAAIAAYFTFGIQTSTMINFAWAFIPVGLLWSVWRWRVHCSNSAELAIAGKLHSNRSGWSETGKEYQREYLEQAVDLKGNVDKVIPWVIAWPTSMIACFAGDLIRAVKIAVVDWFGNIYRKFSNDALAKFDK